RAGSHDAHSSICERWFADAVRPVSRIRPSTANTPSVQLDSPSKGHRSMVGTRGRRRVRSRAAAARDVLGRALRPTARSVRRGVGIEPTGLNGADPTVETLAQALRHRVEGSRLQPEGLLGVESAPRLPRLAVCEPMLAWRNAQFAARQP